jgi:electron transport complex protein RnfG
VQNNNEKKIMLKEAGILFAITLLAGLMLGFVYELTKEPIRLQEEKAIQEACRAVYVTAEAFEEAAYAPSAELSAQLKETGVEIGTVYNALDAAGAHIGYVLETTTSEGYGGKITLYMGVTNEGQLNGISILSIAETPGLGMRAEEVLVPQFENVKADIFTYTKSQSQAENEIDAISGATITTEAVVNAVNGGVRFVSEELKGGN